MESGALDIIILVIIIGMLIYITNKKEEIENNLGLKVIGFYLLGVFSINLKIKDFSIVIPIGFLIYYVCIKNKPRLNPNTKKKAALFGLIILYLGWINSGIYNFIEYRDRSTKTDNKNIEYIKKDWKLIKKEMEMDSPIVGEFRLDYEKNKNIEFLKFKVIENDKIYNIYYDNGIYEIDVNKIDDSYIYTEYNNGLNNIDINKIMNIVNNVKFEDNTNASRYNISYSSNLDKQYGGNMYGIEDDYSVRKIPKHYEIQGAGIIYSPMKEIDDNSWESIRSDAYLLEYTYDSNNYDDKTITIEDIKNSQTKVFEDNYDVSCIMNMLESGNWVEAKDIDINIEPDLFVKDNEGNVIGLCENEALARRDLEGCSVWYFVSSDLYKNISSVMFK
jgi:hypothetical protein